MSQELLRFFKATYQNDSDCVLIFDRTCSLIWHNGQPAPFELTADLPQLLHFPEEGFPKSGDYTFYSRHLLYRYHLIQAGDEYCIVSCGTQPVLSAALEDETQRRIIQNQLASQYHDTFGIRNAVSELYELIENLDCPEDKQDHLYEYLNIIAGNCSRLLKTPFTLREIIRYFEEFKCEPEHLDCAFALKLFADKCMKTLGWRSGIRVSAQTDSNLSILVSGPRLEFCLTCMLLILCGQEKKSRNITICAKRTGDYASIIFTDDETGDDESVRHLLSRFVPLHRIPEASEEHLVVQQFCKAYNAVLLETIQDGQRSLGLRIPLSGMGTVLTLRSPQADAESPITFYHALLSSIADQRFY
ncbi:MAG: hypothetical protein IJ496_10950 [Ruminococcus sp.]|nr:hypothetical protein [Ruminococcus sp.]